MTLFLSINGTLLPPIFLSVVPLLNSNSLSFLVLTNLFAMILTLL